ncbi:MAG: N-acetylmuramoyl-L-alanine amidase, partial [Actinomyces sp.]
MSTILALSLIATAAPSIEAQQAAAASAETGAPVMDLPLTDSEGDPTDVATGALGDPDGSSALDADAEEPESSGLDDIADDATLAVLTDPVAVDQDFVVAGVTWNSDEGFAESSEIYLRVRDDGTWSDWFEMGSDGSGRDDGVGLSGTEPFLTGGADAVQVGITGSTESLPSDLTVAMVPADPDGEVTLDPTEDDSVEATPTPLATSDADDDGDSTVTTDSTFDEDAQSDTEDPVEPSEEDAESTDESSQNGTGGSVGSGGSALKDLSSLNAAVSSLSVASDLPVNVITRSQWGADESYMTWTPKEVNAPFVIVHHTAGTNSYSASQSASIVNGIYYYHAVKLGWGDIGYNFLVDKYGQVFEGRAGSAEASAGKMVVGAHALGANTGTMGIAMMGTYTSESPTSAELTSVGKMAGWQLSRAGVDPTGSATFTITYSNGKYNKGDKVTLNRIAGHRDVYATECPGNVGYAKLGTIRSIASTIQTGEGSSSANIPKGVVDAVTANSVTSTITANGWAFDKDTTNPITTHVYLDGKAVKAVKANRARADVQKAYGLT